MNSFKSVILAALVAIAASSCSKTSKTSVTETQFDQVTVFTNEQSPLAILCDSTITASIVESDSTGVSIALKGGTFGKNAAVRRFSVLRNQPVPKNVIILVDWETNEELMLIKLVHKQTGVITWFLETPQAIVRFSKLPLPCDEF